MASVEARAAFTYDTQALRTLLNYVPPLVVRSKKNGESGTPGYTLLLAEEASQSVGDYEGGDSPLARPPRSRTSSQGGSFAQAAATTGRGHVTIPTPQEDLPLPEFIAQEMKAIDTCFRYDKIFECFARLRSLVAGIEVIGQKYEPKGTDNYTISPPVAGSSAAEHVALPSTLGCDLVRHFISTCPMYTIAEDKDKTAKTLRNLCLDMEGWGPVSVDKKTGHGTYYKAIEGEKFHSFKCSGIVKSNVVNLASVLLELDLYKEWYPMATMSEEIGTTMTFHKQSKFAVMIPWPFANREVTLNGYGIDDFDATNRIVIVAKGVEDGEFLPDGSPCPSVKKGNARCGMNMSGFVLEIINQNETLVTFMMNVDPRIPHLPTSLLNFVSGRMMGVLLLEMGKAAKKSQDPKSIYQKRMAERQEVYDYLKSRVEQAFANGTLSRGN